MTQDDIALAHALADAAGAAIRPWFRRPFLVETKEDFSPVTIADRDAEAVIRALLAEHRPHDGVIGEEYGEDRPDDFHAFGCSIRSMAPARLWRGGRCSAR